MDGWFFRKQARPGADPASGPRAKPRFHKSPVYKSQKFFNYWKTQHWKGISVTMLRQSKKLPDRPSNSPGFRARLTCRADTIRPITVSSARGVLDASGRKNATVSITREGDRSEGRGPLPSQCARRRIAGEMTGWNLLRIRLCHAARAPFSLAVSFRIGPFCAASFETLYTGWPHAAPRPRQP